MLDYEVCAIALLKAKIDSKILDGQLLDNKVKDSVDYLYNFYLYEDVS